MHNLSTSQEFSLVRTGLAVATMSHEQLTQHIMELTRQAMVRQNIFLDMAAHEDGDTWHNPLTNPPANGEEVLCGLIQGQERRVTRGYIENGRWHLLGESVGADIAIAAWCEIPVFPVLAAVEVG